MMMSLLGHIPPAAQAAYPVRHGNLVVPLIDGEPAFRRICDAVDAAKRCVWVTVAFLDLDAEMPDGRGTFFDVLDHAARRGVDVRVVFWDEPKVEDMVVDSQIFAAVEASHEYLRARASGVRARWDHVADHCHHQKSWVIDAGEPGETAFVGGINVDRASIVAPGHRSGATYLDYAGIHDVYTEVRGPASTDVAHNFVQRWNEASRRGHPLGIYPSPETAQDLSFPVRSAAPAGGTPVQIARSIQSGLYNDSAPAPGSAAYRILAGEFSIGEQYMAAIAAARSTIYLENQIFLCPQLFVELRCALERGVEVVAVAPARAMPEIVRVADDPRVRPVLDLLAALGRYDGFTMAALAAGRDGSPPADVYVHSKVAIVDDVWGTIGSANAIFRSWSGDTELNATFWDAELAAALRRELTSEHCDEDVGDLDALTALRRFAGVARDNAGRRAGGQPMQGLVYAIDPARWVA